MPFVTIAPPPGIFNNGTAYQAKGRWYSGNLIRFQQGERKPIGGWQLRSSASAFMGACRALLSWRDNSNNRWVSVGTHSHLYVQNEAGTNYDITPSGFTAGNASASQNLGYGGGLYGVDYYGVPRPNTTSYLPATVWALDSWGEDLVGCSDADGKIYQWTLNTANPAAVVTNAPTGVASILVTAEGFLFALGQTSDSRRLAWCDQQNLTVWAADATNQAGDYDLTTVGTLQVGKALPSGALLLTDVDAWLATYIGTPLVYGFQRVGSACGIISKGAIAAQDSRAVWMGKGGFWIFDGQSVQPMDCDVQDGVFSNINTTQISKVTAVHLPDEGEVWWFYPSASSNENDSYVCWAYRESIRLGTNIWTMGSLQRLCGSGRGVFPNPLMVDGSGLLYEHETGLNFDGDVPFLQTAPIEIGNGDYMAEIQRIVPDEANSGDVQMTLIGQLWPNSPPVNLGTYSLSSPTDMLQQARQITVRYTAARMADFRIGNFRLEIVQGDPI